MPISLRLIVLLLTGVALAGCDRQKADAPQAPVAGAASDADSGKGIDRSHKGQAAPATVFKNAEGGDTSIAKFAGKPVLVNLWATWCGPCVKELPTLAALEAKGGAVRIVAISQDDGDQASVDAFLKGKGIGRFAAFHDKDMALSSALGVQILPTTMLFDAAGKEVWRFTGDLDWTSAGAAKLLAEAK